MSKSTNSSGWSLTEGHVDKCSSSGLAQTATRPDGGANEAPESSMSRDEVPPNHGSEAPRGTPRVSDHEAVADAQRVSLTSFWTSQPRASGLRSHFGTTAGSATTSCQALARFPLILRRPSTSTACTRR
jgi:hypothetical protein